MQNPLAALSMPTLPALDTSVIPSAEAGDSSFADTFVEAGSEADPEVLPEDTAGSDVFMPYSLPLVVAPRSAFLAMADAAVGADAGLLATVGLSSGPEVLQQVIGSIARVLPSDPGLGGDTADMVDPQELVDVRSPAMHGVGEFGPPVVLDPVASVGATDVPTTSPEIRSVRSFVPAKMENRASQPLIDTPVPGPSANLDTLRTDGLRPAAVQWGSNESPAKTAPNSDAQVLEKVTPPSNNRQQPLVSGNAKQPDLPVPSSENPTVQLQPDGERRGFLEPDTLVPPPHRALVDQAAEEFDLPGTFKAPLPSPAASDGLELVAQDPADVFPVLTSSPSHNLEAGPSAIISSFWERFISHPAIAAQYRDLPTANESPSHGSAMPFGAAVLAVTSEVSDIVAANAPSADPSVQVDAEVNGSVKNSTFHSNPVESPAASPTPEVNSIGISFADSVAADWDKDLQALGQGEESLPSVGPTTLLRTSTGSPVPQVSQSALPVSLVASQLVNVLVRSTGSVTEFSLAPEELGRVRLRMEPDAANPDRMLVLISVERPETLDLFRRHAGELAEAIRNAGYSGADIGFGHSGTDSSPEHRNESSSAGSSLPLEETDHRAPVPMMAAGTSLDLRL